MYVLHLFRDKLSWYDKPCFSPKDYNYKYAFNGVMLTIL